MKKATKKPSPSAAGISRRQRAFKQGRRAEVYARWVLRAKGYRLLARHFRRCLLLRRLCPSAPGRTSGIVTGFPSPRRFIITFLNETDSLTPYRPAPRARYSEARHGGVAPFGCAFCAPEQGKSGTILALTAMIIFNHASWNLSLIHI